MILPLSDNGHLRAIDEFPKTTTGKIQKALLRDEGVTADTGVTASTAKKRG
jgi:acyl-coenzyme A synthetase/AMP-(fatty) acid ligase